MTPPTDGGRPLADVLTPAAIVPTLPTGGGLDRVAIELVRDDVPRPTTALRCPLRDLRAWADSATTKQLAGLRVAFAGDDVLVLGTLPPIARAERFWGDTVRLPLGFTLRPALGPASLQAYVKGQDLRPWIEHGIDPAAIVLEATGKSLAFVLHLP